jgi:hypothetical protein
MVSSFGVKMKGLGVAGSYTLRQVVVFKKFLKRLVNFLTNKG